MKKQKFTPISELGELGLINKITNNFFIKHKSTIKGIGDDAAVLYLDKNRSQLISTDMLVEGIHFDPSYCPLKHVGYKSIIVNASDIYAMNGVPTQALISIAVPNKYSVEAISSIYEGVGLACRNYNIDLIGGDTTATLNNLVISVVIMGQVEPNKITYRSGAKINDLLVVSGDLGGSFLGLQILEREKMIFEQNQKSQPVLDQYSLLLEKQLKPEGRADVIKKLNQLNIVPTSMIDVSDGLSSECLHIATASKAGLNIHEAKIPISEVTKKTAEELNLDPMVCALHGGEDYELLFTVSMKDFDKINKISEWSIIGNVTNKSNGVKLITSAGQSLDLKKNAWDSFRKE
jgi:thiamine-monophosphate kinase